MRLLSFLVATLTVISGAFAIDVQKSVIITYPEDTPDSVLNKAKGAIRDGGGVITHEYQLIKYVMSHSFVLSFSLSFPLPIRRPSTGGLT